jgi:hypothetical protein
MTIHRKLVQSVVRTDLIFSIFRFLRHFFPFLIFPQCFSFHISPFHIFPFSFSTAIHKETHHIISESMRQMLCSLRANSIVT